MSNRRLRLFRIYRPPKGRATLIPTARKVTKELARPGGLSRYCGYFHSLGGRGTIEHTL
jgi:hypothetical protein